MSQGGCGSGDRSALVAPVLINGQGPFSLFLDAGAGRTVLVQRQRGHRDWRRSAAKHGSASGARSN